MWIVLAVVMPLGLLWVAHGCKPENRDKNAGGIRSE